MSLQTDERSVPDAAAQEQLEEVLGVELDLASLVEEASSSMD